MRAEARTANQIEASFGRQSEIAGFAAERCDALDKLYNFQDNLRLSITRTLARSGSGTLKHLACYINYYEC